MLLDEVCRADVGEQFITLSLTDPDAPLIAHQPIALQISYELALPSGVALPLVATVSSGRSLPSYQRRVFRRVAPAEFTFTPREGGRHLVRISEVYHQRWWGFIYLDVVGPRLREGTL
jgi:hypothetical protein